MEAEDSLFLTGTHPVKMDAKGRILLPAAWRSALRQSCIGAGEDSNGTLYIVNDFQYPQLRFYSRREYQKLSEQVARLESPKWQRLMNMRFFGESQEVEMQFDNKSRMLVRINKNLRDHAHLRPGDDMSLIAEGRMLSLWRDEWLDLRIRDEPVPHMRPDHQIPTEILMQFGLWEEKADWSAADTSR